MNYLRQRWQSFSCGFNGILLLVGTQANARLHLLATFVVILAGFHFEVSLSDWALLVLAMASVWVSEAMNTAVELVVDLCSPDYHHLAGKAKDVAAGAVLIASIFAVVVGFLVFAGKLGS